MTGKATAKVSTHSRLKAAGVPDRHVILGAKSFNTQPPEGGWDHKLFHARNQVGFNTQPPEGGWVKGATPKA